MLLTLQKQGWLQLTSYAALKEVFTDSDSIDQMLRPGTDPKTKQPSYERIKDRTFKKVTGIEALTSKSGIAKRSAFNINKQLIFKGMVF